jgi:hypothetical protein
MLILRVLYALASVLQSDWAHDVVRMTQLLIRNVTRPFPPVHIIKNRADRSGTETRVNPVSEAFLL